MKTLRLILLIVLFLAGPMAVNGALPSWETVQSSVPETEQLDVTVKDGYIYVYTSQPITVKVLSIVGQLVSEQRIPAGVSRLKIASRGIYILKAGSITRRVTV